MEYRVELSARAFSDLDEIFAFIHGDQSSHAFSWFNGLEARIFSLDRMPERGIRTREHAGLRQLLYGNKPHIYRIIYKVNQARLTVLVLHIRHGAQDNFQPSDVLIQ